MQVYVSNREIEQIAEGLVEVSCGKPPPKCIDIDRVARFLGVTIVYERIAEDDPDEIGFAADGNTALKVFRNGVKKAVIFPRDYVVLEQFLQHPEERSRCRFVKAHEISHILLRRADPTQNTACFNRLYDTERTYSMAELRDRWNLGECQANTMAAMLLMPRAVLTASVRRHIYEPKMNAFLEHTVFKYLRPTDEPISLTDIARRFEPENPSYLIQSWLRSRNTIEFLGEWERNNNKQFNEEAFQKLLKDVRSPSYTLTPKRWIETVNAIGLESKRGKNGGTMAHPFIACDFEMWNDMQFRYEVLKYFMGSRVDAK